MSFKDIKTKESTLLAAIHLTKTEFVEKFAEHDKEEVGSTWHSLRSSTKGQKLLDMKQTKAKLSGGDEVVITKVSDTVTAASLVSAEEEAIAEQQESPSKKKPAKKEKKAPAEEVKEEPAIEEAAGPDPKAVKPDAKKPGKVKKKEEPKEEVAEEAAPEPVEVPTGVSREEQVRALYEGGETSATKIARAIGANPSYVFTLLKKIKGA